MGLNCKQPGVTIILRAPNPDKPEITNYKHQITNKFQITLTKSQIRPNSNCLEF